MKYNIVYFLTLCFCCFFSIINQAQNLDDIFDDDNMSNFRVIAKTGFDVVYSDIPILIEYKVIKRLSIEGGVNFLNIDRLKRKHTKEPIIDLPDEKYRISPSFKVKIYFREVNEGSYCGLGLRWAKLNDNNFFDGFFLLGYQRSIYRKIVGDITIGFGLKYYQERFYPFYDKFYTGKVYTPINFKIGYLF